MKNRDTHRWRFHFLLGLSLTPGWNDRSAWGKPKRNDPTMAGWWFKKHIEKYESVGMMKYSIYVKIMFQTTRQMDNANPLLGRFWPCQNTITTITHRYPADNPRQGCWAWNNETNSDTCQSNQRISYLYIYMVNLRWPTKVILGWVMWVK